MKKRQQEMLVHSLESAGVKDITKTKAQKQKREIVVDNIIAQEEEPTHRLMLGIPLTGMLRAEWALARWGQIIPTNWSVVDTYQWIDQFSPMRHTVADARNILATIAVEKNFEWCFFLDHDVVLPPGALVRIAEMMQEKEPVPVWSGLYWTKSVPSEPLIYRGRGTGHYKKWQLGDRVWVSGIPMGCTLIHVSILEAMYDESEEYYIGNDRVRRIFETPAKIWYDPETPGWHTETGTEDIWWCHRVITGRFFDKSGWKKYQEKRYPFMLDTSIFCRHIDWNGIQYPTMGEEWDYIPKNIKKLLNLQDV